MSDITADNSTCFSAPDARPETLGLVIFDCDGVVIDSEIISACTLMELLSRWEINIDAEYVRRNFLGRSFPTVTGIVEQQFGVPLPSDFESDYRRMLLERFETQLRPMPGVMELLGSLQHPYCLATSSSPKRVRRSLELTGLQSSFEGMVFTASEVANGKPAPDLFLHAAATCGVSPDDCLVVEDSDVGLQAARAAGMRVVWFKGGGHMRGNDGKQGELPDPSVRPDFQIYGLSELPGILSRYGMTSGNVCYGC